MLLDDSWFTEAADGYGMSIKIRERIHEERSPYQLIEIYETETFGRLMTLDGITMITSRDNFIYHEMMTHPVLFTHSNPKQVVIVGGGDCGSLREVLKHEQVQSVLQVELDERVTRAAEKFFPELCESNNDPRAEFLFEDAIEWMYNAEEGSRDIIILDTTDPVGQAERLFSTAFYRECLRVLADGGIMVTQSESPLFDLDILEGIWTSMRHAGAEDIMTIQFPQCTYPSGWWTATMARKAQTLTGFRETASRKKAFATRYYNADIHQACQALPTFLTEALEKICQS